MNRLVLIILDTYYGDTNLDGEYNSSDQVQVMQAGEYEDDVANNSTWAEGDWNGDDEYDSSDNTLASQRGGYDQPNKGGVQCDAPADWRQLVPDLERGKRNGAVGYSRLRRRQRVLLMCAAVWFPASTAKFCNRYGTDEPEKLSKAPAASAQQAQLSFTGDTGGSSRYKILAVQLLW